jgi:hypothetical protein
VLQLLMESDAEGLIGARTCSCHYRAKILHYPRLVIVAPADAALKLDIKPEFDLAGGLKGGHLAMAGSHSVPAGKYGYAAVEEIVADESLRLTRPSSGCSCCALTGRFLNSIKK